MAERRISFLRCCYGRSDEAIKSFRFFVPSRLTHFARSGRIEEDIEILHHKLKRIEAELTFGGKRWKFARRQGRRVQSDGKQAKNNIEGPHNQPNNAKLKGLDRAHAWGDLGNGLDEGPGEDLRKNQHDAQ
ncbi:hypothetical protein QQ045_010259 [Rhodiola kirilowii]